MYSAIYII